MILTDSIKSAYNGLSTSKGRSLLTILGIVIGIMSIMIVMSLGAGAQRLILDQVDSLGSKIIFVSDSRQAGGPPQPTDALDDRDLAELRKKTNVPNARLVLASAFNSQRITFGSEAFDGAVQGITPEWERAFSLTPAQGDFISFDDVRGATKVAVIGHTVRKELFPGEDPIGQIIKVKNNSFRVIGVLPEKGQLALFGYDQSVFLPISTFQNTILNAKNYGNFLIEVDDEVNINATVEDIKRTLRFTHNIQVGEDDDFDVQPQADLADRLGAITTGFSLFLIAVAAISLVVGGVGIMNIMLVSVSERTREIGLRKAVGATNKDILMQFLIEAIMLTGVGGIIGIMLGGGVSYLAAYSIRNFAKLDWSFEFPIQGMVIGLVVAVSIGLVFGIYPARKAAQKSPTEALRYE